MPKPEELEDKENSNEEAPEQADMSAQLRAMAEVLETQPASGVTQESKEEKEKDPETERAMAWFGQVFDSHKNGQERTEEILKRMAPFLDSQFVAGKEIQKLLEQHSATEDKDAFIDGVASALKPIFEFREKNPEEFGKILREAFVEQGGFTKVNEILSYGEYKDLVHIHLASSDGMKIGEVKRKFLEGLGQLAEIIKNKEEIKKITATSWIVAKNSKLLEKLGFTVEGELSEELKREHFTGDKRPISRASISREDFLKIYSLEK
jgi:hypothetical protein